jgi:tetratricopeptide (TPR) repeat protein
MMENIMIEQQAKDAFDNGDFQSSLDLFKKASVGNPNNPLLIQWIAQCHYKLGNHEQAISTGHEAIQLQSDLSEAHLVLAKAYFQLQEDDKAKEEIATTLSLDPDNAIAHSLSANLHLNEGAIDQALDEARTSIELDDTLWYAHFVLGAAYALQGNNRVAVTSLKTAYKLHPHHETLFPLLRGYAHIYKYLLRVALGINLVLAFFITGHLIFFIIPSAIFIFIGLINYEGGWRKSGLINVLIAILIMTAYFVLYQ